MTDDRGEGEAGMKGGHENYQTKPIGESSSVI